MALPGTGDLASVKVTEVRGATAAARYLGNGRVDVSGLVPGLYLMTVSDGHREYRQKFIKE